jgi:small subunit ribosomal protein S4
LGNIKKQRKKFDSPFKKWDKTRADAEDTLVFEFGLGNKREVWKANRVIARMRNTARTLFTKSGPVAERTKKDVLARAQKLGLLAVENATLDDLLGLTTKDLFGRRLQTVIVRKGLANTMTQARQFITHGHVVIGERVVTVPGYLVTKSEEGSIELHPKSALASPSHPARMTPQKKEDARLLDELRKKKEKEKATAEATPEAAPTAEEAPDAEIVEALPKEDEEEV